MSIEAVKRAAAEFALDEVLHQMARDPERTIFTLLDFADYLAVHPEHKEKVRKLREHLINQPRIFHQAKRLCKNPKMLTKIMTNWVAHNYLMGAPLREKTSKSLGVSVPAFILIDPTSACNLYCYGCWAGGYSQSKYLEPRLLDRILGEARDLGIYWVVFSGGEPFIYKHLLDIVGKYPDMMFMAYTNGTLISEKVADRLAELGNLTPAFSLEGWRFQTDGRRGTGTFDRVMRSMDLLRERGVLFGASLTVTRCNAEVLFSNEFMDFLIEKGVVYAWSFHYIPIGRDPNPNLMLTCTQRAWLARRVPEIRREKPILMADFWNDGEATRGCIGGGRVYFHINAAGDVEPCAFAHFAVDNIRDKSVKSVLGNPLFKAFQERQPFNQNHLAPCPIIDLPQVLRDMLAECGACPTHSGAESFITGSIANHIDKISEDWRMEADRIKERKEEVVKY